MSRWAWASVAGALVCLVQCARAQPDGVWSAVQPWPVVSVHAILLPNGQVMFYSFDDDARLWDPATGTMRDLARVGYNIFCTGHSYVGDGRLLVTGGHIQNGRGLNDASYYDPVNDTWTRLPDMNDGRWYPTSTTLGDGNVLITSGSRSGGGVNDLPQVWQVGPGTWRNLSSAVLQLPLYPRQFLAPNGQVFVATRVSRYLDPAGTGHWTPVAPRLGPGRDNYGSACLYDDGQILFSGGGDPPLASCEVIDLNASTAAWREVAPMRYPRRQHNLTLLPDGTVLATGGSSGAGFDNIQAPVLATELWDPATEMWRTLASSARYRGYHSIALLLPDGRVLSAGGDYELNAELFSPPYLFRGTRPTVTTAPSAVSYGEIFQVDTPDANAISQVNWLRLGAVTHGFNMDQRINRLTFSRGEGTLAVVAPTEPNRCPPGIYMLFVLNEQGVPSVGRMIRVVTRETVAETAPVSEQSFINGMTPGRLRADFTGWVGLQFTMGDTPVTVTALGRICVAGNSGTRRLKLVDAATGQEMAATDLSMAGGAPGQFKYATLATPVQLLARRSYYLASHETAWTDRWYDLDTRVQNAPIGSCDSPVYQTGSSWIKLGFPSRSYGPVSFLYQSGAVVSTYSLTASPLPPEAGSTTGGGIYRAGEQATVSASPEPGYSFLHWSESGQILSTNLTFTFGVSGPRTLYARFQPAATQTEEQQEGTPLFNVLSLGKVRNDYGGWVGTQIRVGAAGVSVTALGRMTLPGNRQTHTVKLVDSATGQDLGAVDLSMAGGSAGEFRYGLLPAPLLLNPGRLYYLVSHERLGGDTWHDYAGQVQTTAAITLPGAIYWSGSGWVSVSVPNRGYGPLNLIHGGAAPNQPVLTVVRLTQPADRALFEVPASIELAAEVDPPGAAQRVEFHVGASKIGDAIAHPFKTLWNVSAPGSYLLTATAVAVDGRRATSEPVTVHMQTPGLPPETNLIAHWRFDEGAGNHAIDGQGGLTGALMNGPVWVAGRSGAALRFDGMNDYVNVPHQPVLNLGPAFSIGFWFRPAHVLNASSGRKDLLKKHLSYWVIMNYPLQDGKLVFVLNSGTPLVRSNTTSWQPDRWYHAVATCDGTSMKLYVNGVLEGAVSSNLLPSPNSFPLQIGGNSDQNVFFPGAIDDVRVYRTALDPAFVATLWEP